MRERERRETDPRARISDYADAWGKSRDFQATILHAPLVVIRDSARVRDLAAEALRGNKGDKEASASDTRASVLWEL